MRGLVLACGPVTLAVPDGVRVRTLPERPGKGDVDALLTESFVVAGTDADLAAVVLRLLRKDLLASTSLGYVPADRRSAVAGLWGLPTDPDAALQVALTGATQEGPLVRNDAGGVLLGRGVLTRVNGVAYCDDTVALRGAARSIEVRPDGALGLAVTVTKGGFLPRRETFESRAFQLSCDPTVPVSDDVPHPRATERWTWYRHTEPLHLATGKTAGAQW